MTNSAVDLRGVWSSLRSRAAGLRRRRIRFGDLARTTPVNSEWGRGRGRPLDRVYIERFLDRHRSDIRGRALEAGSDRYVRLFGSSLDTVDVIDVRPGHAKATVIADLQNAPELPDESFDSIVLTQVLPFVFDVRAAVGTVHRLLAPGGVLLATVSGIARVSPEDAAAYGDWWRFTSQSARRLTTDAFGEGNVEVESFGNVLVAAAFLYGLGSDDLRPEDLDVHDPLFEVVIGIRAVRSA